MAGNDQENKALLVGILLPKATTQELEGSMDELQRLVKTLGYETIGRLIQKRGSDKQRNVLGEGKLKELAQWTGGSGVVSAFARRKTKAALRRESALEDGLDKDEGFNEDEEGEADPFDPVEVSGPTADIVIVDTELSPSQIRNLENATGVKVLDRTGVIIEIFSRHAKTKAAALQVEIARLKYMAPRIRETGGEDRQIGGGGKGLGESRLELDKRRIRDRIKLLSEELAAMGNQQEIRLARREQEQCVALVGYTNAGKSSLMRRLTGSEVLVANKLFATLDTTVRSLYPESVPKILISDTVGFIKKLPHDLVASFKSTLDEALHASLLLFVVDSSDPSFRSQLDVTRSVLKEVGATDTPSLLILNKKDCLSGLEVESLRKEFPDAIMISTKDPEDVKMMRETIMSYFEGGMLDDELFVPYQSKGFIGEIRSKMRVLDETYEQEGVRLKVRSTEENILRIKKRLFALEHE